MVSEAFDGAPSPATITTIDVAGRVDKRVMRPEEVDSALADLFGIGAPAPGPAPCPAICIASARCLNAVIALCQVSGGAFCLASDVCPTPSFCANCQLQGAAPPLAMATTRERMAAGTGAAPAPAADIAPIVGTGAVGAQAPAGV